MPVTVIIAIRLVSPVMASTVTVTVPLLLPEAGDTVNQEASMLTVQVVLEEMVKVFCPPDMRENPIRAA